MVGLYGEYGECRAKPIFLWKIGGGGGFVFPLVMLYARKYDSLKLHSTNVKLRNIWKHHTKTTPVQ